MTPNTPTRPTTPPSPAPGRRRERLWWLASAIAVGCLLGLGLFTFQYAEGLSYFSTDPSACTNCHIMQPQFDSWQKATHHTVAGCVDCHLPRAFAAKWISKAENGFLHSKGFTFQDFHEPIFIRTRNLKILNDNCLHCHGGMVHDIASLPQNDADPYRCVHCHQGAGHGETVGLGKYEPVAAGTNSPNTTP